MVGSSASVLLICGLFIAVSGAPIPGDATLCATLKANKVPDFLSAKVTEADTTKINVLDQGIPAFSLKKGVQYSIVVDVTPMLGFVLQAVNSLGASVGQFLNISHCAKEVTCEGSTYLTHLAQGDQTPCLESLQWELGSTETPVTGSSNAGSKKVFFKALVPSGASVVESITSPIVPIVEVSAQTDALVGSVSNQTLDIASGVSAGIQSAGSQIGSQVDPSVAQLGLSSSQTSVAGVGSQLIPGPSPLDAQSVPGGSPISSQSIHGPSPIGAQSAGSQIGSQVDPSVAQLGLSSSKTSVAGVGSQSIPGPSPIGAQSVPGGSPISSQPVAGSSLEVQPVPGASIEVQVPGVPNLEVPPTSSSTPTTTTPSPFGHPVAP